MRTPNVQRNNQVRAAFVARGTSFHAWCKSKGLDPHNARKAVLGTWSGPKASAILRQIDEEIRSAP
ncbi:MAG: hypothetical protein CMO55_14350 [Verrucomicrobiales bacterium]|nr:hypothetical protein [Verrucomicrobiales bacterium]